MAGGFNKSLQKSDLSSKVHLRELEHQYLGSVIALLIPLNCTTCKIVDVSEANENPAKRENYNLTLFPIKNSESFKVFYCKVLFTFRNRATIELKLLQHLS